MANLLQTIYVTHVPQLELAFISLSLRWTIIEEYSLLGNPYFDA